MALLVSYPLQFPDPRLSPFRHNPVPVTSKVQQQHHQTISRSQVIFATAINMSTIALMPEIYLIQVGWGRYKAGVKTNRTVAPLQHFGRAKFRLLCSLPREY